MNEKIQDQTQFSIEEPFLESPVVIPSEEVEKKAPVPFLRRRKTILIGIIILVLFLIGGLYLYALVIQQSRLLGDPNEVVIVTPAPKPQSSFSVEVKQLQDELNIADPVNQELLIPSLDDKIRLEPVSR